mmetsp:Transcript_27295/g.42929  ORF Transcript_27295/g.42929 Transcript_27295/m.42929 type:complete len:148 (+) Transcript_27295:131-574(+)
MTMFAVFSYALKLYEELLAAVWNWLMVDFRATTLYIEKIFGRHVKSRAEKSMRHSQTTSNFTDITRCCSQFIAVEMDRTLFDCYSPDLAAMAKYVCVNVGRDERRGPSFLRWPFSEGGVLDEDEELDSMMAEQLVMNVFDDARAAGA